ncbi:uncharacterized protein si:ch211-227n13.3 [Thalassophryne amazonica]|uniref:uncharacterized protein si:ch211-227n13.3 n=1 Tax=Thalassophryne amazonica TaxID=390379 RepID=UPI001471B22D|nr:uncharacterized protein si:ch211-227n13.3 [Thalassophryne amazonica]
MYSTRHQTSSIAQASQTLEEDVIQRRFGNKRLRRRLKEPQRGNSVVSTDVKANFDLISFTDGRHEKDAVSEKDKEHFGEVDVEASKEQCNSPSSTSSGPTFTLFRTTMNPNFLCGLCSSCWKLYQKAKRMKTPIKDKLLDNDPTSWTCDQWVLIKKWQPRRHCHKRRKSLVQVVEKQLTIKKGGRRYESCLREQEPPTCSRPHIFLQRNLSQCAKVPVRRGRKKGRRKRSRDDVQDVRKVKQQRIHSSRFQQSISTGFTDSRIPARSRSFNGYDKQKDERNNAEDLVFELIPSTVTLETTKTEEAPTKKQAQKKTGSFRDLLVQLRGNSSVIVQETCS